MMRFKTLALALALALAPLSTAAFAGDCNVVKQQVSEEQLWTCVAAFKKSTSATSRTQCFTNADEGFTWVAKQFADADQIMQATCRHQGKNVRYRDWMNEQKAGG